MQYSYDIFKVSRVPFIISDVFILLQLLCYSEFIKCVKWYILGMIDDIYIADDSITISDINYFIATTNITMYIHSTAFIYIDEMQCS